MIAKIIVAFLLVILLILLMYGAIIGIKENDKARECQNWIEIKQLLNE